MISKFAKLSLVIVILSCSSCIAEPAGYYDGGSGYYPPDYGGYYGYGPAYPWDSGVALDISNGYGHGGYGRGGYGLGGGGRR
ncbi:MAG: hypothetical protein WCD70_04735 [Alphaproteobacteria bacterium]